MIRNLLTKDEGKTLEFKENCRSLRNIVRTAVAFTLFTAVNWHHCYRNT